jgi:hypothetical protein
MKGFPFAAAVRVTDERGPDAVRPPSDLDACDCGCLRSQHPGNMRCRIHQDCHRFKRVAGLAEFLRERLT